MSLIDKLVQQYADSKAKVLDAELIRFLEEQNIPYRGLNDVKKELEKRGLTIVQEYRRTESQEVYTFKLCKVYAHRTINIPLPEPLSSTSL